MSSASPPGTLGGTPARTHADSGQSDDVRARIDALAPWFHNIHLPSGEETVPEHWIGGDFPRFKWQQIEPHVPSDLNGWRVLDVGCNAGFYSVELAKRGADVVAIDVDDHYLRQARWVAEQFGLSDRIELRRAQVYDLAHLDETFDLVWFMGVFYHLRYPLLGLDIVAQKARRMLVFQTLTMPGTDVYEDTADHDITERAVFDEAGWPKMAFIEHRFSGDPTNWWAANHAGVEAMLRSTGMRITARPAEEIYVCEPGSPPPDWQLAEYRAAAGLVTQRAAAGPTTQRAPTTPACPTNEESP